MLAQQLDNHQDADEDETLQEVLLHQGGCDGCGSGRHRQPPPRGPLAAPPGIEGQGDTPRHERHGEELAVGLVGGEGRRDQERGHHHGGPARPAVPREEEGPPRDPEHGGDGERDAEQADGSVPVGGGGQPEDHHQHGRPVDVQVAVQELAADAPVSGEVQVAPLVRAERLADVHQADDDHRGTGPRQHGPGAGPVGLADRVRAPVGERRHSPVPPIGPHEGAGSPSSAAAAAGRRPR